MSEAVILKGNMREPGRKGPARALRREGMLPGIIYGHGENVPVSVNAKEVLKLLESAGGSHRVIHSEIEGDSKTRSLMIKSLDVHPITDSLIHIDLLEIDEKKPMKLFIELEFVGVPRGVKEKGGVMKIHMKKLFIECLPGDIPPNLVIQVKDLDIGQSIKAGDVMHEESVKVLTGHDENVVSVTVPKAAKEAEGEGEGEAVEGAAAEGK